MTTQPQDWTWELLRWRRFQWHLEPSGLWQWWRETCSRWLARITHIPRPDIAFNQTGKITWSEIWPKKKNPARGRSPILSLQKRKRNKQSRVKSNQTSQWRRTTFQRRATWYIHSEVFQAIRGSHMNIYTSHSHKVCALFIEQVGREQVRSECYSFVYVCFGVFLWEITRGIGIDKQFFMIDKYPKNIDLLSPSGEF